MELIKIDQDSGIPLIGLAYIGILTRNNNSLLQIRPTTICNMKCAFCSTAANSLKIHPRNFIVDKDYLVAWIKEVINYLEGIDIAHIDSVGDPTTYPDLIPLIKEIKKLKIKTISMVTNGILLNNIKGLKEAGLDKINISIHTLNKEKIKELLKNKLEVWLTPVYIQNFNEADIEDLIELSKELKCNIGIQKYEFHKYGRKMKTKEETYYSFYKKINEWENKYNLKLGFKAKDIEVKKTKKLPQKFKLNEKINIEIKAKGWMPNQMIGTARNRAITILDCNKPVNSTVKAKIIQMKNNIYVAK